MFQSFVKRYLAITEIKKKRPKHGAVQLDSLVLGRSKVGQNAAGIFGGD